MDVSSLYTNIPQEEGTEIVCKTYDSFHNYNPSIPTRFLKEMLRLILNENSFHFNGENYLQTHGTTVGTKMAVSFANIFMAKIETMLIQQSETKPKEWRKYIDNIFSLLDSDKKTWINLLDTLTNSTLPSNSQPKYQKARLLSSIQWCSKEKDSKMNPMWTSKLTTNLLRPLNIHIATHAIHLALRMLSLKAKQ